jgi:hypothetical protein
MYYRCIRFNTNQEKNQVRDTILLEQKDLSVLENGAPMWNSHSRENGGALLYNSPDYPVCHRTVRRASGATASCANGRLCKVLQCATVPRQNQKRRSHMVPDCPVWLEDKALQRLTAQNPNGCADVARTGQCAVAVRWRTRLSGAPIASSLGQQLQCGWGL